MLFLGKATATIDDKRRIAVPAKFRAKHPAHNNAGEGDKPVWISVPWPDGPLIRLYPEPVFVRLAAQQEEALTPDEDTAAIEQLFFSHAEELEMDSAGRLRLPEQHVQLARLGSDVTVLGVKNRLELHNRETWEPGEAERFAQLPRVVARADQRGKRESER